jgi:hypothetical protein
MASDSPKVVEVNFELQLVDVEQGLAVLPRARLSKMFGWFGVFAVLAIIAWRWHEGRDPSLLAVVGVLLIAMFVFGRDPTKRIARRVYDALPNEARQVALRCNDQGIQLQSSDSSTLLPWTDVTRVLEARTSFLIFASRTSAQIVPKRALTAEHVTTLRHLVARYVVPRREPWLTDAVFRRILIYALLFAAVWAIYKYRVFH